MINIFKPINSNLTMNLCTKRLQGKYILKFWHAQETFKLCDKRFLNSLYNGVRNTGVGVNN